MGRRDGCCCYFVELACSRNEVMFMVCDVALFFHDGGAGLGLRGGADQRPTNERPEMACVFLSRFFVVFFPVKQYPLRGREYNGHRGGGVGEGVLFVYLLSFEALVLFFYFEATT